MVINFHSKIEQCSHDLYNHGLEPNSGQVVQMRMLYFIYNMDFRSISIAKIKLHWIEQQKNNCNRELHLDFLVMSL